MRRFFSRESVQAWLKRSRTRQSLVSVKFGFKRSRSNETKVASCDLAKGFETNEPYDIAQGLLGLKVSLFRLSPDLKCN